VGRSCRLRVNIPLRCYRVSIRLVRGGPADRDNGRAVNAPGADRRQVIPGHISRAVPVPARISSTLPRLAGSWPGLRRSVCISTYSRAGAG